MKTAGVLITGCGGMLGSAVYPYFISRYKYVLATDKTVNERWLEKLDVRDNIALRRIFDEYKPDIVLHLAAETDLEYCETHPHIAEDTNCFATKDIARLSEEFKSTLVYISTAGVFDGRKKGFYTEHDNPNPIMVYGQTKYEGEIESLRHCSRTFVVRAGWMMGGGRNKEKKFIYKILQQIGQGRKEIFAVTDRWGTPTYTYDFAKNLFNLIDSKKYGTYHMVCEGRGNRYDVAKEILKICNRPDIKLTKVDSDFFKQEYFVVRPASEMLINENLARLGLNSMRPWRKALHDYIENYFYDYIVQSDIGRTERRKHNRRHCYSPVKYSSQDAPEQHVAGIRIDTSVSGTGLITDAALQFGQIMTFHKTGEASTDKPAVKLKGIYRIGLESLLDNRYIVTNIFKLDGKKSYLSEDCTWRRTADSMQ
jgi:dTDP-4-dehydrorhamnose reductase